MEEREQRGTEGKRDKNKYGCKQNRRERQWSTGRWKNKTSLAHQPRRPWILSLTV